MGADGVALMKGCYSILYLYEKEGRMRGHSTLGCTEEALALLCAEKTISIVRPNF